MNNRRGFLKNSAALGALSMVKPVFSQQLQRNNPSGYFNVHPFIEEHPEAVFIMKTDVDRLSNHPAKKEIGVRFARSVLVPSDNSGIPVTHMIPIKPNLTASMWDNDGFTLEYGHGIVTDPYFVEGMIESMKDLGLSSGQFYIREVNGPECFEPRMWTAMCQRTGADLRDLNTDVREMPKENVHWTDVPNPEIHEKIPHLWPINAPDTFYLNIGKFKCNMSGMTLSCKNHQGSIANKYQRFCQGSMALEKLNYEHLVPNVVKKMEDLYKRHLDQDFFLWDKGYDFYGFKNTSEIWCNRTLDNVSSTKMGLAIVEAISSREGCFHRGPNPPRHNTKGVTEARDFMTNFIMFGKDAVLVDNVGTWLGGHEPGNFGFFHIAMERNLSKVLDPRKVPVYLWEDGNATRIPLEKLTQTPIRANYIPKKEGDSNKGNVYYMYNEPFDYSAIAQGELEGSYKPGSRVLDKVRPGKNNPTVAIEYTTPDSDYARIDIFDVNGKYVDCILKGFVYKGPGCAVWNIENHPAGNYTYTFQTRNHEEKKDIVIRA
ncbi:MAG: DUF362 domain-containing protein [Candidatus Latescibacteria bacterium]|nr:DUF362 domain-containing protein [Candidatus Latescibacterota bacterium]